MPEEQKAEGQGAAAGQRATERAAPRAGADVAARARPAPKPGEQPCPRCGHPMPDLKGGTGSICAVCGFKDSCCY
jgi:hypothetical protein